MLERAKAEYIRKTYKIDSWTDTEDFLEKLAARTGKLLKVCQLPAFAGWKSVWPVLNMAMFLLLTGHGRAVCPANTDINCPCFSQGGEPDLQTVSKMVLNDWQRGRIPFFVKPPNAESGQPDPQVRMRCLCLLFPHI